MNDSISQNGESGTGESGTGEARQSWWRRLRGGLARTSASIATAISDLVSKRKLDAGVLEELEEVLIRADLGVGAAARIAAAVGEGRYDKTVSADEVKAILAAEIEKILVPVAVPLAIDAACKPFVILVAGVNGSGKTTTIGKLAARYSREAAASCWRRATPSVPPPSSSSRSGASGPGARSSPAPRAPMPPGSSTRPSPRRGRRPSTC
jgi:signal recognition particle GTPase